MTDLAPATPQAHRLSVAPMMDWTCISEKRKTGERLNAARHLL